MSAAAQAAKPAAARRIGGPFGGPLAYAAIAALATLAAVYAPFDDYILHILVETSTYAIAVFGLTVVLGLCGQINLAQAAFFGLGAYAVGLGTSDLHVSFWLALVAGACVALVMGAFLGMSTLRLGGHYLAMVTISFQQILTLVMINWIPVTHGPDGVGNIARPALFASGHGFLGALRRRPRARRLSRLASSRDEARPLDARRARQ